MSRTVVVKCRDRKFWAFDLALGIWLKTAIDAINERGWHGEPNPSADEIEQWKHVAVLGSNSLLDLTSRANTADRQARFAELAGAVAARLGDLGLVSGAEVASWRLLDDLVIARADAPHYAKNGMPVQPILTLGKALADVVNGQLRPSPAGTWWFFGYDEEPVRTIEMNKRWR